MSLAPGSRLGPYEVVGTLGAGGMGEVYEARDTRLERIVAIKVLPTFLAADPAVQQRFEREARAISALSHPHVCALHDVGEADGVRYLVMERLEGESVAERLARGRMPVGEVVRFGVQIASALDAAHRKGIVHRDLKPSNVLLTRDGAKLLDFGLARTAADAAAPMDGWAHAATAEKPLTAEGTILGTFQYMAPEQLEGEPADARTDIFALGTLLYEMATGRRAFQADTRTSLIAAIVSAQPPPVADLVPLTPPALEHVIARCLEKDPEQRWQSARDVASELSWVAEAGSHAGVAAPVAASRRRTARLAWSLAAALAIVASALGGWAVVHLRAHQAARPLAVSLVPPEGAAIFDAAPSPDGGRVALVVGRDGETELWIRSLADPGGTPVAGTRGAFSPFWSPDGRSLGFVRGEALFKVAVDGDGSPEQIAVASSLRGRPAWGPGDRILFSPSWNTPIHAVAASGGAVRPVTRLGEGEAYHQGAFFMPDGRFLFYVGRAPDTEGVREGIYVASPGAAGKRLVWPTNIGAGAFYAGGGRLLLFGGSDLRRLLILDLDAEDLTPLGPAIERELAFHPGSFAASADLGVLAIVPITGELGRTLAWYDRQGRAEAPLTEPGPIADLELSSDGHRALYRLRQEEPGDVARLMGVELRQALTRTLVSTPGGVFYRPVFSGDGRFFTYSRQRTAGVTELVRQSFDGGPEEVLLSAEGDLTGGDESADGRRLLFMVMTGSRGSGMEELTLPAGSRRRILAATAGEVIFDARYQPGGEWIAYNARGRAAVGALGEVFVCRADGSEWTQVSAGGGTEPRWRGDGRELFYWNGKDELVATDVAADGDRIELGPARVLFQAPRFLYNSSYGVAPDGQRFLITVRPPLRPTSAYVLLDWLPGRPGS